MKPWYTSKTLWFNVFSFFAAASTALPALEGVISQQNYAIILFFVTMGNVGLRMITTQGITK